MLSVFAARPSILMRSWESILLSSKLLCCREPKSTRSSLQRSKRNSTWSRATSSLICCLFRALTRLLLHSTYSFWSCSIDKSLLETLTGNHFPDSVDTYAVARNVEDISAAKLTPILPDQASLELKKHSSWMTSSSSSSVSWIHPIFHQNRKERKKSILLKQTCDFLGVS